MLAKDSKSKQNPHDKLNFWLLKGSKEKTKNRTIMRKRMATNWALLLSFILSASSGIRLHFLEHGMGHGACHLWRTFHLWVSIMLLVLVLIHIKMHWNWYRNWFRKGLGSKSWTTALLSITFLLLALTGIILLGGVCRRSIIGIWHFYLGIAMIILAVMHIFKRWARLISAH